MNFRILYVWISTALRDPRDLQGCGVLMLFVDSFQNFQSFIALKQFGSKDTTISACSAGERTLLGSTKQVYYHSVGGGGR
jgi:hypothetical protein